MIKIDKGILYIIVNMLILIFISLLQFVFCDIYMHNPRGSNNRCDELTNDRRNENRLFDSQNNAAGGYAVPCMETDLSCYNMKYYTESYLDIRYTTQHACGIQNQCEIIIQYACGMRNGEPSSSLGNTCTNTMPDNMLNLNNTIYGYHETYDSYQKCKLRPRNLNLYTGDNILRGLSSIYTRQNPNGNRYGFECPEERDYYPYWNESIWTDIAVLTSNLSMCSYYMNTTKNTNLICIDINNTQVNRLGATYEGTSESSFRWKLPSTSSNNCVLRLRYNISLPTDLSWFANKKNNNDHKTDPLILVDGSYVRLALRTDQLSRTFEDRSYTFDIIPRIVNLTGNIYNINVMGKRGNIAQVRNCFEYDFVPNNITIYDDEYIHFQWVGSDFNPVNNEGEGRVRTDRSNLVDITDYFGYNRTQNNTFIPYELIYSFVYQYQNNNSCFTVEELILGRKILDTQSLMNCALLNNASVYFNSIPFKINISNNMTYYYMSTRNNNFSNRNQKGVINIIKKPDNIIFLPTEKTIISIVTNSITTNSIVTNSVEIFNNINNTLGSSSNNNLSGTTISGIIAGIIGFVGIILIVFYVKRNYNSIKGSALNIKRSFSTHV